MHWKLPTWKGLVGLLTLLGSLISVLTVNASTLPHSYDLGLALAGSFLIAVERWADTQDNAVAASAPVLRPALGDATIPAGFAAAPVVGS